MGRIVLSMHFRAIGRSLFFEFKFDESEQTGDESEVRDGRTGPRRRDEKGFQRSQGSIPMTITSTELIPLLWNIVIRDVWMA